MSQGTWLGAVLSSETQFQEAGVSRPIRPIANIVSGATIADDPTNDRTNITVTGGGSGLPSSPVQGDLVYYNGTAWVALAPGTSGQFLETLGASANPQWQTISQLPASPTQGDIVYYNGTAWVRLTPGMSGQFLQTQGASANPQWANAPGANGSQTLYTTTGNPAVHVLNTITETTLATYSMSGGTLPSNGHLSLKASLALFNNSGSSVTNTFRFKFGGGTVLSFAPPNGSSGANFAFATIEVTVTAAGATNAQFFDGKYVQNSGTAFGITTNAFANTLMGGNTGTADTTSAVTIALTVQSGSSTSTQYVDLYGATIVLY